MEEYGNIKSLNVYKNGRAYNNKAITYFEIKKEAKRAIPGINKYPGWKTSLCYYTYKTQEEREEAKTA